MAVAVVAGEAAAKLDDAVHALCATVVRAAGGRMRCTALVTNHDHGQFAHLEAHHWLRARCEDRIRNAKDTGLANLPLRGFAGNTLWCHLLMLAAELVAWAQMLALHGTKARRWELKKLKARLFEIWSARGSRATRTAKRTTSRLRSPRTPSPSSESPTAATRRRFTGWGRLKHRRRRADPSRPYGTKRPQILPCWLPLRTARSSCLRAKQFPTKSARWERRQRLSSRRTSTRNAPRSIAYRGVRGPGRSDGRGDAGLLLDFVVRVNDGLSDTTPGAGVVAVVLRLLADLLRILPPGTTGRRRLLATLNSPILTRIELRLPITIREFAERGLREVGTNSRRISSWRARCSGEPWCCG
ncbi:hypothetical protein B8W73_02625 [Arthrobacter agilis]|nr:hypothetical protein B8W73_02625 [Arthrobacter agilis]